MDVKGSNSPLFSAVASLSGSDTTRAFYWFIDEQTFRLVFTSLDISDGGFLVFRRGEWFLEEPLFL